MSFEYRPELISSEAKQKRIVQRNTFLGFPLTGNYEKTNHTLSFPIYYHRGFHQKEDEINQILYQSVPDVYFTKK